MASGMLEWMEETRREIEATLDGVSGGGGARRMSADRPIPRDGFTSGGRRMSADLQMDRDGFYARDPVYGTGWRHSLGFDRLDLAALKRAFRSESRYGRLSKADFEGVLQRMTGFSYAAGNGAVADALFAAMDTDNSGSLDWGEVYSGMAILCQGSVNERLEVAFSMFDANGNGYIEESELRRLLLRVAGVRHRNGVESLVQQIMRDADWTRDRRLSWSEFSRSAMASGMLEWMEETRREIEATLDGVSGGARCTHAVI